MNAVRCAACGNPSPGAWCALPDCPGYLPDDEFDPLAVRKHGKGGAVMTDHATPCDFGEHYDCLGCTCTCHPRPADPAACTDECCTDTRAPHTGLYGAMNWRPSDGTWP